MNQETYKRSGSILRDLGFDFSADGILDHMKLPPVSEWHRDKKLRLFAPIRAKLKDEDIPLLERAIKNCRSGSKASINGKFLEDAVEALARQHGCEVRRNVRLNDVAKESIDCVIKFPDGKEVYVMCQMDFWSGGQQTNRAEKYLNRNDATFISVVYNPYNPPSSSSRRNEKAQEVYRWISKAHNERRLMWLADLEDYIKERNEGRS